MSIRINNSTALPAVAGAGFIWRFFKLSNLAQELARLTVKADVVPAKLLNDAGIVGAAMAAAESEARAATTA